MNSPFCTAVEKAFEGLVVKHGFQVTERGRSVIAYETPKMRVVLSHDDQRSFEVGIGLSAKADPPQPAYSFDELLNALQVPDSDGITGYAARDAEAAEAILKRMADILNRHATRLLDGDPDAWTKLFEQRRSDCLAYAAATRLVQAKEVADEAWAAQDYQKFVLGLADVEPQLGKTYAAKLAYARRTIAQ
jgi:hypothetical protein